MIRFVLLIFLIISCTAGIAQTPPDSLKLKQIQTPDSCTAHRFKITQLILPITLTGIGAIGLENDWAKYQNHEIRDELQENIDRRISVDDFSQFAPMASVFALNLTGIKSTHSIKDKAIIMTTSVLIMAATVNSIKYITHVQRPDGSTRNSFPSGHTATAFMGAEMLRMEYRDASPWIGIAGYSVALGTGFFRMYNNRHWFTDVIAGAGIGILSTKAAYWLFPLIERLLFGSNHHNSVVATPLLNNEIKGLSLAFRI